jgi:uncharacterized membrane protein
VSPARRRYIDWARAVAILVMIEAHTLDAWTRPADRHGHTFRNLTVLGGFAAPLFLWLAGIALVLSAERTARQTGSRRAAASLVCRRGLELFILAFLFRLQAFIASPGNAPVMLFRVDILNIMGPAIVAAGILWGLTRGAGTMMACGVAAAAVAMATPLVRVAGWVTALPIWLQWYIRPSGDYTLFSLFPWAGFLFAGSAVGVLVASARDSRTERRLHASLAAVGAALIVGGFWMAARPTIYRESSFWTSSPTFFSIRLGVMMLWLPAVYAADSWLGARYPVVAAGGATPSSLLAPLERLGRSSLFVYWIHVELVYGYATWPLHRHLSLWQMATAYLVFCAAMYGAVVMRDRVVATWQARGDNLLSRPQLN